MTAWLQRQWYEQRRLSPALWLLLPLLGLFAALSGLHRWAYRFGWLRQTRLPVPVIVVGNLVVGGAGKTPLVLWLVQELRQRGYRPGIISRGYGGRSEGVLAVTPDADPSAVGDEPLLLARRSGVPVWIGRRRAAAGAALLAAHAEIDVLVSDDGLQHYALARNAEVAVFDGRGAGNGWRLPMGPLREPLTRLQEVSALVFNGQRSLPNTAMGKVPHFDMRLDPGRFYRLDDPQITCDPASLRGRPLHAVAGIGDPARFFRTLEALGLVFEAHPFPDHHAYSAADFAFPSGAVILMTEKDAVKCAGLTTSEIWVLPVEAQLPPALADILLENINGR